MRRAFIRWAPLHLFLLVAGNRLFAKAIGLVSLTAAQAYLDWSIAMLHDRLERARWLTARNNLRLKEMKE